MAVKKRAKHKPKPKPVINYPPVPTKKWIPPDQRPRKDKPPPAYTKPEGMHQKLKISSLKRIWNQFLVYGKVAILPGHYSQTYKKYTFKTNGYQGACNCAVACTFAYIHKMKTWTRYFLDRILDLGDDLYVKSIQQESGRCLTLVPPEQVFNSFFLDKTKILLNINVGPKISETLPSVTPQKIKEFMGRSMEDFLKLYPSGIFALREKYLAVWSDDEAYYVFDPTDHEESGNVWTGVPGNGVAMLYRCNTLEDMIETICNNVNAKIPHTKYEIIECTVSRITNINTSPPVTFEDFMQNEVVETTGVVVEEETEEAKPIDVLTEKLKSYMKNKRANTTPFKIKLEEISPDVTEDLPPSKRPSWLQESIDKNDECMFPIPRKPQLDKITFYVDCTLSGVSILRGSTCQTDPKFSKYEGRQSMGNAISALTMLRFRNSRVWVPRMVNVILKYGDMLYRDAMISIPRTQSLKLSNFQKKTEFENKTFLPTIEDFVVVGRLQSLDYEVLDLFPALENFLIDHECCVILGPVTLAVWTEDGYYYWFDPNERDKEGKAITKCIPATDVTVPMEHAPGVACVVKFCRLQDLVDLYMNNVEKSHKFDPFYISNVQINDYVEVPDSWYCFKGLIPGKWILRGTTTQASKKFIKESRNYQGPANCLVALAFHTLIQEKDWTSETVDEILKIGDQLYNDSVESLKNDDKFVSKMLTIGEVSLVVTIRDKLATFEIGECCVNGIINTRSHRRIKDLKNGLLEFFEDNDMGVVTSHNISVAVWKKDGLFYCFDSHPRNDKGLATNYGTACALKVSQIEELASSLEINLSPGKEDFYNISWVKIKFCEVADGIIRPPLNNYTKINDDCAILRSLYSEITNKYDINCRKQTVPMGVMALAYNKLKPAKEWSKADMDEILNKGNNFYSDTMNDIMKEELKPDDEEEKDLDLATTATLTGESVVGTTENEDKTGDSPKIAEVSEEEIKEINEEDGMVDTDNVNKEFYIGLNKMTVEFEDYSEGNIKESLRDSLKSFFDEEQTDDNFNQEAIVESKPLTVVVWRDDKVFYYFDSKPRDKTGKVIGMEEWEEYVPPVAPESEEEEDETGSGYKESDSKDVKDEDEEEEEKEEEDEEEPNVNTDDDETEVKDEEEIEEPKKPVVEVENVEEKVAPVMAIRVEAGEGEGDRGDEEEEMIKVPVVHKSSSYWKEQEKNGKACTIWFTKLDDLINHLCGNISPEDTYTQDFALRSVRLVNTVVLKDRLQPEDERNDVYAGDWYDFRELDHGRWIMRGSMNLMSEMFPEQNRGKQQITASLVAVALAYVFSMLCFDDCTVDTILIYGDKLYTFMKRMRKRLLKQIHDVKLKDDEIDWLVQNEDYDLRDVVKKICIWKFFVDIGVEEDYVTGDINSEVEEVLDVQRGLETFFSECQYGLMQCKGLTVAIWRGQKMYFMFDGMNRGPNGIVSANGTGCITRYLDLEDMSKVFLENLPDFGSNHFFIHKVTMIKDLCPRAREAKELRENPKRKGVTSGGFHNVVAGKCIVRGKMSVQDPKFTQGPALLCAPIAIVALTMSLIHKPNTWSKPIVDEILELGAELSDESVHDLGYQFNPWEDVLDISKVKNDYTIGVLKANCEFRSKDQKGIIDSKASYTLNLRQGIEQFFEENTHGVLTAADLILAIWEEEEQSETLIYMFDPNPRGHTGMPLDTGTACVMTFVNAKLAADHIIGCILDPEAKMKEFAIVPVEIVVGDAKTKRKLKKTATSEVGVLPRCSKLIAGEAKRTLRKMAANQSKKKRTKELQKIGRNGFYVMKNGDAILRGYKSQNSSSYHEKSRNNQDIPNCIVAIVMHKMIPIDTWTYKHIDLVLDTGNQLYIDSFITYSPKNEKLGLENIMRKFFLNNLEIHVTVYKPIISDIFNVSNLNRILNVYFQQESYCMLSYLDQWVSIFTKEGYYYLFDPHERDIEGNPMKQDDEGTAVVVKFDHLNSLTLKVVQNLYVDMDKSVKEFKLWLISVESK